MPESPVVILTQEQTDNEHLGSKLDALGISWLSYPCIATQLLPYKGDTLPGGGELEDFKVVAFTSKRGVAGMLEVKERLLDARPIVACVGDATALEVKTLLGLDCSIRTRIQTSVGLTQAIANKLSEPAALLHPRGNKTSGEFKLTMEGQGWKVCEVVVYENIAPDMEPLGEVKTAAVVFASPSAAKRFFETNHDLTQRTSCIAIGPTTGQALHTLGAVDVIEAKQPSIDGLADSIRLNIQQGTRT